jgi:hypothetical protein
VRLAAGVLFGQVCVIACGAQCAGFALRRAEMEANKAAVRACTCIRSCTSDSLLWCLGVRLVQACCLFGCTL